MCTNLNVIKGWPTRRAKEHSGVAGHSRRNGGAALGAGVVEENLSAYAAGHRTGGAECTVAAAHRAAGADADHCHYRRADSAGCGGGLIYFAAEKVILGRAGSDAGRFGAKEAS